MMPAPSHVSQNYHPDCEAGVNGQINLQIYASCVYLSMALHFDRDDVALKRFSHFFLRCSHKHKEQVEGLLHLQNRYGGRFCLRDLSKPDRANWESGLQAMQCALHLEKTVNQSLLDLHQLATAKNDPHLGHFLKTRHLHQQAEAIKELGDHVSNLQKMGAPQVGVAEYLFDKLTLGDRDKQD